MRLWAYYLMAVSKWENDLQFIRNLPADYSETVWIDKKEKWK